MTLTDQIRDGLKARNLSLNAISRETGLQRVTVRAFLNDGVVSSTTLDAIAEFLGASVTIPEPPAKKPADKKSK